MIGGTFIETEPGESIHERERSQDGRRRVWDVSENDRGLTLSDANAGRTPRVSAVAYTNPDTDPMTGTTLYDIDSALDVLTTQAPPNNGRLNTVGSLGIDVREQAGFDIRFEEAANVAYWSRAARATTTARARSRAGSTG